MFQKARNEKLVLFVVTKVKNIQTKLQIHLLKNLPIYMVPLKYLLKRKFNLIKMEKWIENFYLKIFDK